MTFFLLLAHFAINPLPPLRKLAFWPASVISDSLPVAAADAQDKKQIATQQPAINSNQPMAAYGH